MELILIIFLAVSICLSAIALTSILIIQRKHKIPSERCTKKDRRAVDRRHYERRSEGRNSSDRRSNDRRNNDRRVRNGSIFDRENVLSIFAPTFSEQSN